MLHAMKKFLGLKDYGGMKRFRATAPTKPLALFRKLTANSLWMHDDDIEEWSGALEHDLLIGQIG